MKKGKRSQKAEANPETEVESPDLTLLITPGGESQGLDLSNLEKHTVHDLPVVTGLEESKDPGPGIASGTSHDLDPGADLDRIQSTDDILDHTREGREGHDRIPEEKRGVPRICLDEASLGPGIGGEVDPDPGKERDLAPDPKIEGGRLIHPETRGEVDRGLGIDEGRDPSRGTLVIEMVRSHRTDTRTESFLLLIKFTLLWLPSRFFDM